ncbi:hypothetical protein CQA53_06120 [Helicobacter didelphidarum]|uniref:TonB-dependent receptor n=1 Tax=Helicobacter didelphidarum TaxID=2040648 RepID=A0A3D8IKF3_9HELI|nr:TonB-dependent receptor [Helicobacter didelphidarum]RDU65732.1 hypothetical protein CQA53_06120 [Helicobacter didelphidarum]
MKFLKNKILVLLIVSFYSTHLSANNKIHKLDSVISTGSTLETAVAKIPGNLDVVSEKTIHKYTNSKITDIIKKLPSIRIDNDVGFNPRPKIKIRGINYGTLIMLDNVILSDLEGENRLLNQISLYDVKRVEVARGAFSSLYGTSAIGGVVNFITSMPTNFEIESLTGYGNEIVQNNAEKNLTKLYFSIGNAFFEKNLKVKFSAGMTNSQGYVSHPAYLDVAPTGDINGGYYDKEGKYIIGDEGRREYQIWDTRLKLEYNISDSDTISSMFSLSNHNYEFVNPTTLLKDPAGNPTFLIPTSTPTNTMYDPFIGSSYAGYGSYTHFLGNVSYTHFFEDSELRFQISSVNLFSRWIDAVQKEATQAGGAGWTQDINTSNNYLDIIYHAHLGDKHNLTTSMQFRYLNFDNLNRNVTNWRDKTSVIDGAYKGYGGMAFVASAFINWEAQWLDSLSSAIGIRYDYWLNFNGYVFGDVANLSLKNQHTSQVSPKVSLNYQPFSWWILKTSIGSGFRTPTMREKYQSPHGNTVWDSNSNLKPETGISFEVGTEFNLNYLQAKLYYFHTELFDMIYRQGAGNKNSPFMYANAGKGRVNGIEFSLILPIWQSLRIEGNYTFTMAKVLENNARPESIGKQLIDTPEHMGNVSLSYGEDFGFYASLWAYFTSAFFNDDINSPVLARTFGYYDAQFSLNAKLGYIFKNNLDISVSFLNMTNNRYYDFYQVAGASFYLQTRYKFGK